MKEAYSRYTFLLFFAAVAALSLWIIWPFLTPIVGGIILGYIFYPLYDKINLKIKRKRLASLLTTIIILAVLLIPFIILVSTMAHEASAFYITSKQKFTNGNIFNAESECKEGFACAVNLQFKGVMQDEKIRRHAMDFVSAVSLSINKYTSSVLISIPKVILNFIIMIFFVFFTFIDGKEMVARFFRMLPLKQHFKSDLLQQIKEVIGATVYGTIMVALIEGILATTAFLLIGMTSPFLWGILVVIVAIIPVIGASIIWVPASLYFILAGAAASNNIMVWKGTGLFLYGLIIISSVETFLKPKIIGHKSNLHPLLVLFGVLGGIAAFGVVGLVVGPMILAILFSFIKVYERDKHEIIS